MYEPITLYLCTHRQSYFCNWENENKDIKFDRKRKETKTETKMLFWLRLLNLNFMDDKINTCKHMSNLH